MNLNIEEINQRIEKSLSIENLQNIEKEFLARENGKITLALQGLGKLPADERKVVGAELNRIKSLILKAIDVQRKIIKDNEIIEKIKNERIDITAPANYNLFCENKGSLHLITETKNLLIDILHKYKFAIYAGDYDIESTYHNFTSLNTHELHPARQTQDTIYIDSNSIEEVIRNNEKYFQNNENDEFLLRTHTSAQQTRIAQLIISQIHKDNKEELDYKFKYATLGRTYRNESDGTHSPMFHQMELVAISNNIYPQDLIEMIMNLLSEFFEISRDELKINLRSNYFPFTNPSWEVDLFLPSKNAWIEVLGCGMIHEKVLESMGLNSKIYRGYALGAGLERLCMLKNNIQDLRQFFSSDIEWLKYYSNSN
jgi:phenylalanyl-tRNA synthetase alpha chain